MNERLRIGEVTQRAQVTPRTVRYYESIGLIPPGERKGAGQRHYPETTVVRLKKIEQLKQIGLSLDEIGQVIDLYFQDATGRQPKLKVLAILRQHLAETDDKLAALTRFRSEIHGHIQRFENWFQEMDHK